MVQCLLFLKCLLRLVYLRVCVRVCAFVCMCQRVMCHVCALMCHVNLIVFARVLTPSTLADET